MIHKKLCDLPKDFCKLDNDDVLDTDRTKGACVSDIDVHVTNQSWARPRKLVYSVRNLYVND